MSKIALIDGDSFLYRAGFAVEKTKYLVRLKETYCELAPSAKEASAMQGLDVWTRKELGTVDDAIAIIDSMLRTAIEKVGNPVHFVYLSPSTGNFRDTLATLRKYKGNRDGRSRPVYYSDLREHLRTSWSAVIAVKEEADDHISWVSRFNRESGKEPVIVGIDKDLRQIPGDHYDWVKDEHFTITEDEARLAFWEQVLAGDEGDNVTGCWGLGEKGARKFLQRCHSLSDEDIWPKIVRKYEDSKKKEGCPYVDKDAEEVALETARLVRLRQKVSEIWTPNTKEWNGKKKSAGHATEQPPF